MRDRFAALSTPLVADACLRLGIPLRLAPPALTPLAAGMRVAGRVLPVRHAGSVDVYLEAVLAAEPGDVLVIDNGARDDEACIGDLALLDALAAGVAGVVVWGLHRDTAELLGIGAPVFSLGAFPTGPRRLDARHPEALTSARVGHVVVTARDAVFADDDGALFVAIDLVDEVLETAAAIAVTERRQADLIRGGTTLRDQVRFGDYLAARSAEPELTFRDHLRRVRGEIEV
jgi:Demethylmenaquinone methyltransferase